MKNEHFCGLCKKDKKTYREKAYFRNHFFSKPLFGHVGHGEFAQNFSLF
jgi:hypothetical protein